MAYTTKKAARHAIRSLPALRASLRWHKREVLRDLKRCAESASSTRLRAAYYDRARKVAASGLAGLRASYQAQRVNEIRSARRFELSRAIPGIVWLGA